MAKTCQHHGMRGKKIPDEVRAKIKALIPYLGQSQHKDEGQRLRDALKAHLPAINPQDLEVSPRTIARIAAEAKAAGQPHKRPRRPKHPKTREQREKEVTRRQKVKDALQALHEGMTYRAAAESAGVSVSTLVRHRRAEKASREGAPSRASAGTALPAGGHGRPGLEAEDPQDLQLDVATPEERRERQGERQEDDER